MVIEVRPVPLKACASMVVTELPMVTDASDSQLLNALMPIVFIEPERSMAARLLHESKADLPMVFTELPNFTDFRRSNRRKFQH